MKKQHGIFESHNLPFFESCRICWLQSYTFNDFVSHGRSKQHLNRSFKIDDLDFYRRAAKPKKTSLVAVSAMIPWKGWKAGKRRKNASRRLYAASTPSPGPLGATGAAVQCVERPPSAARAPVTGPARTTRGPVGTTPGAV